MQLSRIKVRQFLQMLAIEDFRTVLNYAVQRVTTPLFNVHYIFEIDLTRAQELNDPGRPPPQGFAIGIFRGENEIGPIAGKLRRAGTNGAVLTERTKRGDLVAIAFDEEDEVGAYTWATFTDVWMKEIRATLLLDRDETSGIDTFVLPRWRGKGLQYVLEARKFRHLSEHGFIFAHRPTSRLKVPG
jgi:GNAT superfamily N-acetyltransferase